MELKWYETETETEICGQVTSLSMKMLKLIVKFKLEKGYSKCSFPMENESGDQMNKHSNYLSADRTRSFVVIDVLIWCLRLSP